MNSGYTYLYMMYPYGYYGYGYGMNWGVWGALLHAVLVILTIIIVLWVVRRFVLGRDGGRQWHHWRERLTSRSGLDILSERYAKGEIDKAEYEERKRTLLGE